MCIEHCAVVTNSYQNGFQKKIYVANKYEYWICAECKKFRNTKK